MDTPKMRPMEGSSTISSMGYDHEAKKLWLRFKSGGLYSYDDVPQDLHEALTSAKSVGTHFHAHVRGKFKHTKHEG